MSNTHLAKTCPECSHRFPGNGWSGLEAHWRSKSANHEAIMPFKKAGPLIQSGKYQSKKGA